VASETMSSCPGSLSSQAGVLFGGSLQSSATSVRKDLRCYSSCQVCFLFPLFFFFFSASNNMIIKYGGMGRAVGA
jgi:hypothetical protein